MPIELVMPSSHLILCCPLLLLLPIPPSIRVFSNESALRIRWPTYWIFNFSISPSNEHPGLMSFRMDWWNLRAIQGTLKSLLQHHSSKASIFQCSGFFTVSYMWAYVRLPRWLRGKEFTCGEGDKGSIPGLRRSAGEGNATHSIILVWRIPWTVEPGRL